VKARKNQRIQIKIREYERCMTEEIPEYLGRESARERKMMARFTCGNEGERKQVLDERRGKNVNEVP
jgi:hypothetical protein